MITLSTRLVPISALTWPSCAVVHHQSIAGLRGAQHRRYRAPASASSLRARLYRAPASRTVSPFSRVRATPRQRIGSGIIPR